MRCVLVGHHAPVADDPKWMSLLGLTRNPGRQQRFSLRHAALSLLVMVVVAAFIRLVLAALTDIDERWATALSVGAGYVVSMLTAGGPFVPRD